MSDQDYRRYTDLPSLIHILSKQELTLLDPKHWDDKNDSKYIALYKEKQNLKTVLSLCFTEASETYHHWRVFSPTPSGICIHFKGKELHDAAEKVSNLRLKSVDYLTIKELKRDQIDRNRFPFLKRYPFKPEKEFRMLWESSSEVLESLPVRIPLSAISRITLSPWLHPSLVDGIKTLIKSIPGCHSIRIYRSTLVGNAEWIKHGETAN